MKAFSFSFHCLDQFVGSQGYMSMLSFTLDCRLMLIADCSESDGVLTGAKVENYNK